MADGCRALGTSQTARVRIGTWNLAGRWDDRHLGLIGEMDCDLLLLTEVSERVRLPAHHLHLGRGLMAPRRRWAAVAARESLVPEADPHGASAMAQWRGQLVCSSILPWRSCGSRHPWVGNSTAERTVEAVGAIEAAQPTIWGGDWNHALVGREWSGSIAVRNALLAAVARLGLEAATTEAPHQIDDLLSIDHIALPRDWEVARPERLRALYAGVRISDHDAYVVEVTSQSAGTSEAGPR